MPTQENPEPERNYVAAARQAMDHEKHRLKRFFLWRIVGIAAVFALAGYVRDSDYGNETLNSLMLMAATAAAAVLATGVALHIPTVRGLLWAETPRTQPMTTRYRATTSFLTVAVLVLPMWIAVLAPVAAFGLIFALWPLGVFVSNSMLTASAAAWARETADLALAERWSEAGTEGD